MQCKRILRVVRQTVSAEDTADAVAAEADAAMDASGVQINARTNRSDQRSEQRSDQRGPRPVIGSNAAASCAASSFSNFGITKVPAIWPACGIPADSPSRRIHFEVPGTCPYASEA